MRLTTSAPVQHLNYQPMVLAAIGLGRRTGSAVSIVVIVLYHVAESLRARGHLLAARPRASSVVSVAR
jgi:hypothetical protein